MNICPICGKHNGPSRENAITHIIMEHNNILIANEFMDLAAKFRDYKARNSRSA